MYGLGPRNYFHSSFNCFDFGVSHSTHDSDEPVRLHLVSHYQPLLILVSTLYRHMHVLSHFIHIHSL